MNRTSEIRKVLLITLVLNLIVSAAKVFYGYYINSVSILSDGYHSLFDGVSNIVGLIGIYIASHPPDEKHPYGHRKYETVFTIFVGVLMFITCIEIFKKSYNSFLGQSETAMITPQSFMVMLITLSVNIFVAIYEKNKGVSLTSEYLIADSKHTRSDIYVSLGVIGGLIISKIGISKADPIAGAIVGIFVAKAGIDIIKESTEILVDRTQMDTSMIKEIACTVDGVIECHEIRTRGTKSHIFVDLHVIVAPSLTVEDAHKIAEIVEKKIKNEISEVVDVVVHIEPSQ
ncbi:cation efflux system protein [Dissulfurispira thermophila]|uniref:Cation efflux system protein n=2 Tax=root TaxID=1 RepID=A0A7G1GXZ9_9BACT|nr:cation diffusion facilitator family transporter [Dissulfurispira thermophila]BCB95260.1 cation efflux system protein [Dissulfurispira thermophila]